MRVEYSYLPVQFADPEPILADLRELVRSGDFTLGAAVAEFERGFAALLGSRHAVGVGTGTDAIFLALKALGIGAGDEVITMPSTFVATVGAIVATGARPVLVDVGDELVIDPAGVEAAITPRTRALLPVHWAGAPADLPELQRIAEGRGIPLVEDSCQAIGAAVNGRTAGTWGAMGCFSLHPLKNLNVWGDGGVVVTDSDALATKLRLLRNHGLSGRDTVTCWGYNSRLDTLQAVVGNHLLPRFQEITGRRIEVAARLDAGLADLAPALVLPPRRAHKRYVYHLYIALSERRDELLAFLQGHGIEAKVHYPVPLHLQPAAAGLGYGPGSFPRAEEQAGRIITLPAHQHLSDAQVDFVIEKVREFHGA